jgi:hypothetical protein
MSKYFAPRSSKAKSSDRSSQKVTASPATMPTPPTAPPKCAAGNYIRFVLVSGHALELDEQSLSEVVGTWADKCCRAICGSKFDTTRVAIPVENILYMETCDGAEID